MSLQIDSSLEGLKSLAPIPEEAKAYKLHLFKHTFHWLSKALPDGPRQDWTVLEAGHGRYGWAELYAQLFNKVYGADIEDYSEFHPGVTSIQADFCKGIPLPEKSVHLIVSHSVLEHVLDVPTALASLDRILVPGGFIFITISPLYYSAEGSHVNHPAQLCNWEHLDPGSRYYLLDNPLPDATTLGHVLNKMTFSDFIGWVGRFPWSILSSYLMIDPRPIPPYVDRSKWSEMDLRTKGFFLLAKKEWHVDYGMK